MFFGTSFTVCFRFMGVYSGFKGISKGLYFIRGAAWAHRSQELGSWVRIGVVQAGQNPKP